MTTELTLQFTGRFAPGRHVTARTLSHSLIHLQRAVDKLAIYKDRGALRKFATLASTEYPIADLIVMPFQPGSIKVPLLNEKFEEIGRKLREILEEPFRIAEEDEGTEIGSLIQQIGPAYNRARHLDPRERSHKALLADPTVEREFVKAAVLGDVNSMIAPVRSKTVKVEDKISLRVQDEKRSRNYTFDKETSKRFARIVRRRQLGPETAYEGFLIGLEKAAFGGFPYSGKFQSITTEKVMRLLVGDEATALALSPFNLKPQKLKMWGAPVTIYGTFDEVRGDVVFLDFIR